MSLNPAARNVTAILGRRQTAQFPVYGGGQAGKGVLVAAAVQEKGRIAAAFAVVLRL
jgi:hypothetical protein